MKKFKGFTLIELLIVIALLGALAVGLLAALDPFEQLKKGTDTGTRNTMGELHGAIIRYYAIKNYMPWCSDADTCTDPATVTADTLSASMIQEIVDVGELKEDFVDLAGAKLSNIYVTGTNDPAVAALCFQPESKSMLNDQNTKFTQTGTVDAACPDGVAGGDCYYCVK